RAACTTRCGSFGWCSTSWDGPMTAEPCRDRRGDVAALALGNLDDEEATRTQAHVDGCARCRAALEDLRRVARVLPAADPERLQSQPVPPAGLGERITRRVRDEALARRRQARRRRLAAVAACAAAVLAVVAVVFLVRDGTGGPRMHEFTIRAAGVEGWFAVEGNEQGTAVRLEHEGLDPQDVYWLWLTDASGRRVSAGTFRGASERSALTLHSALPEEEAVRIWVTDEHDEVVLDSLIAP
ncbi:MAG TPA: anti-sigma factor, partial [Acidimicrobiales bacterium]